MQKSAIQPRAKRHQSEALVRKSQHGTLRIQAERVGVPEQQEANAEMDLFHLKRNGIPQIIEDFRGNNNNSGRSAAAITLRAVMATRKLLSEDDAASSSSSSSSSLAGQMIQLGLVNDLCRVLETAHSPRLQFEAVWGITNAIFTSPQAVAQSGAMLSICRLLGSPSTPLREQCMWSLGNFMSRGPAYRNYVLEECDVDLASKLCHLLCVAHKMTDEQHASLVQPADEDMNLPGVAPVAISRVNYLRQATWALASLLRGGDTLVRAVHQIVSNPAAMRCVRDLVLRSELPHIVANVVWFLADLAETQPRVVLRLGVADRVIELGLHSYASAQAAAAHCISNMSAGDELCLKTLLVARRAELVLIKHVESERRELRPTASWTLSYACSRSDLVCQRLVPHAALFWTLAGDARERSDVRQDAITTLAFVMQSSSSNMGDEEEEQTLVGVLSLFQDEGNGLCRDLALLARALQLLLVLLERRGRFAQAFEERGGLVALYRIESALGADSRHRNNNADDDEVGNLLELVLAVFSEREEREEEEEDALYGSGGMFGGQQQANEEEEEEEEEEEQRGGGDHRRRWGHPTSSSSSSYSSPSRHAHLPGVRAFPDASAAAHRQGYQNYSRE